MAQFHHQQTHFLPLAPFLHYTTASLRGSLAALLRASPRKVPSLQGQPVFRGAPGTATGGIFALQDGISHFTFLNSVLNKTQEANTYQVSFPD